MEQRKLNHTKCECGRDVSIRALIRHLRGTVNNHSKEFIDKCIKLINWHRVDRWAWLKSDGENAVGDPYWCAKVLNGELSLEDLSFNTPRVIGQVTPKTAQRMSKDRSGKGNPSLKGKPIYDIEEIKLFAKKEFIKLEEDCERFKKIELILDKKFPEYRYSFVGKFKNDNSKRGYNKRNFILSYLIDKPIKWLIENKASDRGKFISIGQKKSPKLQNMINAGRDSFKTKSRITIPHKALFNMVLSIDPNANKEKQIDYNKTWKSYDIFSPKGNILIEMHGRIWHDLDGCPESIRKLVIKNIENDNIKEELAQNSGYRLFVFWDNECQSWQDQLEDIYGTKSKSYEQALREELDKKRNEGSL